MAAMVDRVEKVIVEVKTSEWIIRKMKTTIEVPRDKDTQTYVEEMRKNGIDMRPSNNGEPPRLSVIKQPRILQDGKVQKALLKAIDESSNGVAKPEQVDALCKSATVLIELAKLQITAQEKALEVGWLGDVVEK
jgi:hypothetical protein